MNHLYPRRLENLLILYLFSFGKFGLLFLACLFEIFFLKSISHQPKIMWKIYLSSQVQNVLRMWYNKPSTKIPLKNRRFFDNRTLDNLIWQQNTLPIGNSYLGASIFGEISTERVTFNEKTLWNG